MTTKMFFNLLANGKKDILQNFLDLLEEMKINYCVIGGIGVNAYSEPVVSLDLDLVIAVEIIEKLKNKLKNQFSIKKFPHSLNLKSPHSDLRIQIQTDPRYQQFISQAKTMQVMGYEMKVAALEDILKGKVWAYLDNQRRQSKRQKDLADIFRLVEAHPHLNNLLPNSIKGMIGD